MTFLIAKGSVFFGLKNKVIWAPHSPFLLLMVQKSPTTTVWCPSTGEFAGFLNHQPESWWFQLFLLIFTPYIPTKDDEFWQVGWNHQVAQQNFGSAKSVTGTIFCWITSRPDGFDDEIGSESAKSMTSLWQLKYFLRLLPGEMIYII